MLLTLCFTMKNDYANLVAHMTLGIGLANQNTLALITTSKIFHAMVRGPVRWIHSWSRSL
jgi:hypothetical protein